MGPTRTESSPYTQGPREDLPFSDKKDKILAKVTGPRVRVHVKKLPDTELTKRALTGLFWTGRGLLRLQLLLCLLLPSLWFIERGDTLELSGGLSKRSFLPSIRAAAKQRTLGRNSHSLKGGAP